LVRLKFALVQTYIVGPEPVNSAGEV